MERPTGLTVIGWLAIVGGALQIVGSLGLVGVGALGIFVGSTGALELAVLKMSSFPLWTGVLLISLGVLGVVVGFGILALKSWAWIAGVIVYAINLVCGIGLLLMTGISMTTAFTALMSAVILSYLFAPTLHAAFKLHPRGGAPQTPGTPHPAA